MSDYVGKKAIIVGTKLMHIFSIGDKVKIVAEKNENGVHAFLCEKKSCLLWRRHQWVLATDVCIND